MKKTTLLLTIFITVLFGAMLLGLTPDDTAYASDPVVITGKVGVRLSDGTVITDNLTKVYGDADPEFVVVSEGTALALDCVTFTRTSGENVNTDGYTIDVGQVGNAYDLSGVVGNVIKITKRPLTLAAIGGNKTFGEADSLDYGIAEGNLISGDELRGVTVSRDNKSENVNSDGYEIRIGNEFKIMNGTMDMTANYNVTTLTAKLTISKKSITVTSNSAVAVYREGVSAELSAPLPSFFNYTSRAVLDPIDTSVLGERDLTFSVKFYLGNIDKTAEMSQNVQINYEFGKLNIGKRSITITPENYSYTYGSDNFTIPYAVHGSLAEGEALAGKLSRQDITDHNVGRYAAALGTLKIMRGSTDVSDFYNISLTTAQVTVLKKAVSVVFGNLKSFYGDDELSLDEYTAVLRRQLCYTEAEDDSISFVRKNAGVKNVGTYEIVLNKELGNNYILSLENAVYVIDKRNVTVIVSDCRKEYGDADPEYVMTLTSGSLVGNDILEITFERVAGETVGDYDIRIKTVFPPNYNVTLAPSKLTIAPKTLTIKGLIVANKVFDGTTKAFLYYTDNFGLTGIVGDEEVSVALTAGKEMLAEFSDSETGNGKTVRVYNIHLTGADKANYTVSEPVFSANITPMTVSSESSNVVITSVNKTTIKNGTVVKVFSDIATNRTGIASASLGIKHYPKVLAVYKVTLNLDDKAYETHGDLKYDFSIPDKFKNVYGLQLAAVDAEGNAVLLYAVRNGDVLTFTTGEHYSTFYIVAEDNGWLKWTALALSILSVATAALILSLYLKSRRA